MIPTLCIWIGFEICFGFSVIHTLAGICQPLKSDEHHLASMRKFAKKCASCFGSCVNLCTKGSQTHTETSNLNASYCPESQGNAGIISERTRFVFMIRDFAGASTAQWQSVSPVN